MDDRNSDMQVRTFKTMDEVRALTGFKADNLVDKENYLDLFGDYHFPEKERCCLRTKRGHLCKTPHNLGYVVILKDQSLSIIGNVCADDNFEAKSKLIRDRALYTNLKRRKETEARLKELMLGKEGAAAQIQSSLSSLRALSQDINSLYSRLGQTCVSKLKNMARGGTGAVVIQGIKIRTDSKTKDASLRDRDVIAISGGSLKGIDVFRAERITSSMAQLRDIEKAYNEAASFTADVRTADLSKVVARVADLPRVVESIAQLAHSWDQFQASDWKSLPFLVRDQSDRVKLARIALEHGGTICGREKAKQWLQKTEAALKADYNVDKIDYGH